jgi:tetrapyrrole methylase family protein/MazG family protein
MSERSFQGLIDLIKTLRGPNGCPWDKRQDIHSIKKYVLEEAYELLDAISQEDHAGICEEAGDLLFQLLFLLWLEEENGQFSIQDTLQAAKEKMIRRHPHVFGGVRVNGVEEVIDNWEKIKQEERQNESKDQVRLPFSIPGSQRLMEVVRIAKKHGLDFETVANRLYKKSISKSIVGKSGNDVELILFKTLLWYSCLQVLLKNDDVDLFLKELSEAILDVVKEILSEQKSNH